MPLILSAHCPLTAHWGVSPGSRQTEKCIIVWSLDAVSIFTFIFHFCIFRKQLLVSLVSDYSVWDFRGRPARIAAYWKKTHLSSNKQTVWFMKPVTIHGVRFRLCTKLKDLLSHMGREDHVPFIHLAVVMLSLCSYPLSHVILMMYPSSYQPSEAFVYFALATVGGMQAFSSERKKKQQKNCYHFDHVVRGLLMFGPLIIREHPDKIDSKCIKLFFQGISQDIVQSSWWEVCRSDPQLVRELRAQIRIKKVWVCQVMFTRMNFVAGFVLWVKPVNEKTVSHHKIIYE